MLQEKVLSRKRFRDKRNTGKKQKSAPHEVLKLEFAERRFNEKNTTHFL
jgi:hypothetical protein